MTPTAHRVLRYLRDVGPGVWVTQEELYRAIPKAPVRKATSKLRDAGLLEEAAYVMTSYREPGWFYLLRQWAEQRIPGLDPWPWLSAVRLTERGAVYIAKITL